ncbi:serine/threonine protein kinase [Myxococcota bacterium]|nr:serine/threonine protein kinase [Myxococcota bacterium]
MTGPNDRAARRLLAGRYELLDRIGIGGMAEVFRARLPGPSGFEKIVVIKRILPRQADDPNAVQMFVEEAKLTAAANHDNITQVFELGQTDDGEYFIVLEHVDGTDLAQLLHTATAHDLRIPVWLTLHVYAEVLEALSFLHALKDARGRPMSIVHRDVTPSNVLLSKLGKVKLSDFGIAHFLGKTSTTVAGQLKGKLQYMAPEQLENRPLDHRADLFSVAVGLWECLAQRPLFPGRDPEVMLAICEGRRPRLGDVITDVPPELDLVLARALSIARDDRYATAAELQGHLLAVLERLRPGLRRADVRTAIAKLLAPRRDDTAARTVDEDDEDVTAAMRDELRLHLARGSDTRPDDDREVIGVPTLPLRGAEPPAPVASAAAPVVAATVAPVAPRPRFHVRSTSTAPVSVVEWPEALELLHAATIEGTEAALSHDGRRWCALDELSRLVGLELVSSTADAPSNVTVVGSLEQRSLVAAFTALTRERPTGTIAIARTSPVDGTWYEIELVQGRPTKVSTNVASMQLPALLVRERILDAERVASLLFTVLRDRRPLEQLVEEETKKKLSRARLMTARLEALFSWEGADYTFGVDYQAKGEPPFARSLVAPSIIAAERALTAEQLVARLGVRARVRLTPAPGLDAALSQLELEPRHAAITARLSAGRTVAELLDAEPLAARAIAAVAWVLTEASLFVAA